MANPLATLSTGGWVTSVQEIAPKLMQYYLASEYSQSITYLGDIKSLPYTLSIMKRNFIALEDTIRNDLTAVFSSYFERVEIEVSVDENKSLLDTATSEFTIKLFAKISDRGATYNLSRLVSIVDNKIAKVDFEGQ